MTKYEKFKVFVTSVLAGASAQFAVLGIGWLLCGSYLDMQTVIIVSLVGLVVNSCCAGAVLLGE